MTSGTLHMKKGGPIGPPFFVREQEVIVIDEL